MNIYSIPDIRYSFLFNAYSNTLGKSKAKSLTIVAVFSTFLLKQQQYHQNPFGFNPDYAIGFVVPAPFFTGRGVTTRKSGYLET
jgi:hypothetical protein